MRLDTSEAQSWSPLSARWITGYAALWILGFGFLWWPVILVRACFRPGVKRPDFFPVAVFVLLAISLGVAALMGAGLLRIGGAGYNLAVWAALAAVTRFRLDLADMAQGVARLAALQSAAILLAYAVYPRFSDARLPAAYVLPEALVTDPALESFMRVRLVDEGYFGETVIRSAGFFGNATWGGALSALGILTTLWLLPRVSNTGRGFWGAVLLCNVAVLYLSYSRNTWIALGLALAAMGLVWIGKRRSWYSAVALSVAIAVAASWALSVSASALLSRFNSVREGSFDSRALIYQRTWSAVQDLPFPLLGNGVKDRLPGLVASLGTHGTYLGLLYRAGWLAVSLLAIWLVVLAFRAWGSASALGLGSVVFGATWFVAEDLDAGHLAPLALVLAVAAVQGGRPLDRSDVSVAPGTRRVPALRTVSTRR